MSQAIITELSKKYLRATPELKPGYTVRVHQKIKEGDKERIQIFEGLIIKMSGGKGVGGTITVRKVTDGIGVEKIFPIHSPNIAKIEVKKIAKVRRAKLYYMRDLSGKSARLQEQQTNIVSNQELLHTEAEAPEAAAENPEVIETPVEEKVETPAEEIKIETEAKEEIIAEEKTEAPAEEIKAEPEAENKQES